MAILSKAIYRFNVIPIRLPTASFTEPEQNILQFVWEHKRPRIDKTTLKKENRSGGIRLPDPEYTRKVVYHTKTVWYWHKNRNTDQNTPMHLWSIIDKGSKTIQWRKNSLFNKWCWKTGQLHVKECN